MATIISAAHTPLHPVSIGDIKTAKARWEDHMSAHKCLTGDGCPERIRDFIGWMRIGAKWGETYDMARAYRGPDYQVKAAA